MPGLVGFTNYQEKWDNPQEVLREMRDSICHQSYYANDTLFCSDSLYATRSHLNILQPGPQPYSDERIKVWLDGEFYNQDEYSRLGGSEATGLSGSQASTDPQLLLEMYRADSKFDFLRQIDGYFSAVIYDTERQQVHLIADRFGMKLLYKMIHQNQLVWSSEVKAMLELPGFEPRIDEQSVDDFFGRGFLLENRSWFEGVELVGPGTVFSWDIQTGKSRTKRYWHWNEVAVDSGSRDERKIAEEMARLIVAGVESRSRGDLRMGMTLSGGMDSRAILASLLELDSPPEQVSTFGKIGCDDIRIARMVAEKAEIPHHVYFINNRNWLDNRIDAVWWCDGQLDLLHAHGLKVFSHLREYSDVNLHGFPGDGLIGGNYFPAYPDRPLGEAFEGIGRRFENQGCTLMSMFIPARMPLCYNELIEFTLSLPREMIVRHNIYNQALIQRFSDYVTKIPWQSTGTPLGWPWLKRKPYYLAKMVEKTLRQKMQRWGVSNTNRQAHGDFSQWIQMEPTRSIFEKVIYSSDRIYPQYIDEHKGPQLWERQMSQGDCMMELTRLVTFEIWLKQVFLGSYRPDRAEGTRINGAVPNRSVTRVKETACL